MVHQSKLQIEPSVDVQHNLPEHRRLCRYQCNRVHHHCKSYLLLPILLDQHTSFRLRNQTASFSYNRSNCLSNYHLDLN